MKLFQPIYEQVLAWAKHRHAERYLAGVSFAEFNERSWRIPEAYQPYRYSLALHGVGMADEWPVVPLHVDFDSAHAGRFESGQVVCVESLIAAEGTESVKLETQVLVTETGAERLDRFPWEL